MLVLLLLSSLTIIGAEDIMIADFESQSYDNWKVVGKAFGDGPAKWELEGQMDVAGQRGRYVNSYHGGDGSVGILNINFCSILGSGWQLLSTRNKKRGPPDLLLIILSALNWLKEKKRKIKIK